MTQATADRASLVSHWTPLPGWAPDRTLLACYVTVADRPELHRAADAYQQRLADLPQLDLIQRCWLHVTVQGVGFLDTLPDDSVARLAAALRRSPLPAPAVLVRPAVASTDAVYLPFEDDGGLAAVRRRIRSAVAEAFGLPEPYALPGQRGAFRPHLSLAYANAPVSLGLVRARLDSVGHEPFRTALTTLSVIALRRRDSSWRWTDEVRLPLGL